MKIELDLLENMHFVGKSPDGHETHFDSTPEHGGENKAPRPMEVMLEVLAACSAMDVAAIIRKKRKTIESLKVIADGERNDNHPKVFTKVNLKYILKSPDAEMKDLERAVELSQNTYCSASAMFRAAGCEITTELEIIR
jgi:putative redox protein